MEITMNYTSEINKFIRIFYQNNDQFINEQIKSGLNEEDQDEVADKLHAFLTINHICQQDIHTATFECLAENKWELKLNESLLWILFELNENKEVFNISVETSTPLHFSCNEDHSEYVPISKLFIDGLLDVLK